MSAIIFDLDGTIADLWPLERETLLAIAGARRDPEVRNALEPLAASYSGGRPLWKIFRSLFPNRFGSERAFRARYDEVQAELIRTGSCPSFPTYLRREAMERTFGIAFGLATGSSRAEAEYVLKAIGCREFFSSVLILTRENGGAEKGSGRVLTTLRKRFGGRIAFIGDSDSDEKEAAVAGVPFFRVNGSSEGLFERMQGATDALRA